MAESVVTVVKCGRCQRSGDITASDGRLWFAWCQDWAVVETMRVRDATIRTSDTETTLVRVAPVDYPLQPLRVPAGWQMEYNNGLYEVDPLPERIPEDDHWLVFKEDMLQIFHARRNRLLDVGWHPEGDLAGGQYRVVVQDGDFLGKCVHEFHTRDRDELVREMERLFVAVCAGEL